MGDFIICPHCKSAIGAAVHSTHDNNGSLYAADWGWDTGSLSLSPHFVGNVKVHTEWSSHACWF